MVKWFNEFWSWIEKRTKRNCLNCRWCISKHGEELQSQCVYPLTKVFVNEKVCKAHRYRVKNFSYNQIRLAYVIVWAIGLFMILDIKLWLFGVFFVVVGEAINELS